MTWRIDQGDVRDVLRSMPDESVNCIVTSPPYWGLRDYGSEGQLGLEATPEEYVCNMVDVFREARRVLRKDGTLWLNLGDSYASQGGMYDGRADNQPGVGAARVWRDGSGRADGIVDERGQRNRNGNRVIGLKPKDLVGIPWRVAFALQADGWWLRSDIIWSKPNPMPESVTDRPTKAHEYIFLLSKSQRYYYDHEAIKEPAKDPEDDIRRINQQHAANKSVATVERQGLRVRTDKQRGHSRRHAGFNDRWDSMTKEEQAAGGRNKRTVWEVATHPYAEAHFATYPPDLIKPCILAGSPEGGTVLDPFTGSGTTLMVALRHNRNAIGIELNPQYVAMAKARIINDAPLLNGLLA